MLVLPPSRVPSFPPSVGPRFPPGRLPSDAPSLAPGDQIVSTTAGHTLKGGQRLHTSVRTPRLPVFPSPSLQDISSPLGARLHHPCITRRRLQWDSTARSLFATHTYAHHRFPSLGHWGIGIRIGTPQRQRQPPPLQAKGPLPRTAPHTQPLGQLTCHAWWSRKWGNRRPQHPKQLHSSPDWTPLAALQPSRDMQLPVRVSTICLHAHAPPLTGPFCFFFFSCPSCPENYMFLPCLASLVFTSALVVSPVNTHGPRQPAEFVCKPF